MRTIESQVAARIAIVDYLIASAADMPEPLAAQLKEIALAGNVADQIVGTVEYLYSVAPSLDDAGKELAGALAAYASQNGWHGLAGGRGEGIARAMRREIADELGEDESYQDAADDPAVAERYLPPPPNIPTA